MARGGKGDLADYEKVMKGKKEKPSIPRFTDLADDQIINERQELDTYKTQEKYQNSQKDIQTNEHIHIPVTDNITEQFLNQFSNNIKKEDSHTRQTWLIKNETIKRLDKLAKGKKKGFKTELVNQALEMFLDRIE
ncbi:TPA: hypothetical protein QCO67_005074 [Bacillus cereus]|nr:hypothetical protein [Bacillus cereus]HDR3914366.1 hypothetical protein [Bacillus cereus]HDV7172595.1 hypothetical protein [Bacillus cereus]